MDFEISVSDVFNNLLSLRMLYLLLEVLDIRTCQPQEKRNLDFLFKIVMTRRFDTTVTRSGHRREKRNLEILSYLWGHSQKRIPSCNQLLPG